MKYLSVCSGIEAATVAWHSLGFSPVAFSEIDKFPCAVLAHHYPSVPNWGDLTKFKEWPDAAVDVLIGGTPCQSFSVAGLRAGLADPRGNLALTYLAVADRYRPRWLVWENVPGVLSSNKGRDFGAFLGGLGELGYGFAYRVLDAQYFGLAQRRKRVFVVGHLGDWRRAAAVLFERESLSGHPAPRRETREDIAPTVSSGAPFSRTGNSRVECDAFIPEIVPQAMSSKWSKGTSGPARDEVANLVAHSLRGDGFDASEDGTGRGTPLVAAWDERNVTSSTNRTSVEFGAPANTMPSSPLSIIGPAVRRLTPRECERLQGFPDDYTLIPYRGKPAADGPRYKALGNSMAVPVITWLGKRIQLVESLVEEKQRRVA